MTLYFYTFHFYNDKSYVIEMRNRKPLYRLFTNHIQLFLLITISNILSMSATWLS